MLAVIIALAGVTSVLLGLALVYPPLALILGGLAALRVAAFLEANRRPKETS